ARRPAMGKPARADRHRRPDARRAAQPVHPPLREARGQLLQRRVPDLQRPALMASDALSLDIAGLASAYRSAALRPGDTLAQLFAAIDGDARGLNAFCVLDREGAEREAEASERRWREGRPLSPLDGVPVSIKDLVNVAG